MPPRTKACAICRKKRIKCDATLPHCLMCIRTGKQCPGPLDGPLIIDMTNSASGKKIPRKPPNPSPHTQQPIPSAPPPNQPLTLALTLPRQISQTPTINDLFFSHFLTYFTSSGESADLQNRTTWPTRLPYFSADGTNPALALALAATASAYCGAETRNPRVLQHAWSLYGAALRAHGKLLRKRREVTIHMVSTSVMFSIFEAMQSTTADAYRAHISGAVKMLEHTTPSQCTQGVLCQLFFHIRTQLAFVYLTSGKGSAGEGERDVSAQKILRQNLVYGRVPVFQRLMNCISVLAELYTAPLQPEARSREQQVGDECIHTRIRNDVAALWTEYTSRASQHGETLSWCSHGGQWVYRDGFTALCIAYFRTADILLSLLAPDLPPSSNASSDPHTEILVCARYLRTKRIGCAFMRMATPLFIVAVHAPSEELREGAVQVFEEWERGNLGGLSRLALERIGVVRDGVVLGRGKGVWDGHLEAVGRKAVGGFGVEEWLGHV